MSYISDRLKILTLLMTLAFTAPAYSAVERANIKFYPGELSALEKQLMDDSIDGKFDQLSLMGAYFIAMGITNYSSFTNLSHNYSVKYLNTVHGLSGIKDKRDEADKLCQNMHKSILKAYSFNAVFPEPLIRSGYFNCLSSGIVYADLLKRNKIDFCFGKTSSHVFVYVFINNEKILCETTNPIGFDAGNNIITNADGSWRKAVKANYTGIKEQNEAELIASLYYDGRLMGVNSSTPEKSYLLTKKGLFINPADDTLIKNYVSFANKYSIQLMEDNDPGLAKQVSLDTIKMLSKDEEFLKGMLNSITRIVEKPLEDLQFIPALEYLNILKESGDPDFYTLAVENSFLKASYNLSRLDRAEDAIKVIDQGLKLLPGNKKLAGYKQNAELLAAFRKINIDEITRDYHNLVLRSPDDRNVKNQYFNKASTLLLNMIKLDQGDKADKLVQNFSKDCGEEYTDKLIDFGFGNGVKDLIDEGQYSQAIAVGRKGAELRKDGIIQNNYFVALSKGTEDVYFNKGFIAASGMLFKELSLNHTNDLIKVNLGRIIAPVIEEQLVSGKTNYIYTALQKVKEISGENNLNFVIDTGFINAIYRLIKTGEYKQAVETGELALWINKRSTVYNNYMTAIKDYLEERILQKDIFGSLDALIAVLKARPEIKELNKLPEMIFLKPLINTLKEGLTDDAVKILNAFKDHVDPVYLAQLKDKAYINASYELFHDKNYSQGFRIAEIGLKELQNEKLINNYISLFWNWGKYLVDNGSTGEAKQLLEKVRKQYPGHKMILNMENYLSSYGK